MSAGTGTAQNWLKLFHESPVDHRPFPVADLIVGRNQTLLEFDTGQLRQKNQDHRAVSNPVNDLVLVVLFDSFADFVHFFEKLLKLTVDGRFGIWPDDVAVCPPLTYKRDEGGHSTKVGHFEEGDGGVELVPMLFGLQFIFRRGLVIFRVDGCVSASD
jgi:hypothetical protein